MKTFRLRHMPSILLAVAGLAMTSGANAAIVDATITGGTALANGGSVVFLGAGDTPFSVGGDNFGTNNLYIIAEQQDVTLTADTALSLNGTTVTLAAGTVVRSYFFAFDPVVANTTLRASITFDSAILGVARLSSQLTDTNYLGLSGVTYETPGGFALEPGLDFTALGSTVDLTPRLRAGGQDGDVFRVLTIGTPAVPEPASWALMIAGIGLVGVSMRHQQRRAAVRFA